MNLDRLYLIDKIDGFSEEFSKLVSMMNFARATTWEQVWNLSTEELDYLYDDTANSIGMLLYHMAAVEFFYQVHTFENRDLTEEEYEEWKPGLELGDIGRAVIKGHPISFYKEKMDSVRNATLQRFQSLPDTWLYEETPFWRGKQANNYFKWFHVFEDELNHRGQIRLIKKMMNRLYTK
jgi:uncharacterized damage-inducible protein DinB